MFCNTVEAIKYLELHSDTPMEDEAIRCIEEELASLCQELAIAYTQMAECKASILRLAEKYHA